MSSAAEGSLHQFFFDAEYWGSSEWWGEFVFYSLLVYMVTKNFARPRAAEAAKQEQISEQVSAGGLKEVTPEHLRTRKTTNMAYTFYCYGGFLTGSHQIYLGNYTYAILYQGTLGFFGFGVLMDFLLLGFHTAAANRRCHALARPDTFPWRAFFLPAVFTLGLMCFMTAGFLCVPVAAEWYGAIQPYEWPVNPYDALGVPRSASSSEVKKGFREASMRFHPDKNPDCGRECEDKMRELSTAYEIIKKKEKANKKHKERMEELGREAKAPKRRDWIDRLFGLNDNGEVSDEDRAEAGLLENSVYRAVRGWYLLVTNVFPTDLNAWAEKVKKKADRAARKNKKKYNAGAEAAGERKGKAEQKEQPKAHGGAAGGNGKAERGNSGYNQRNYNHASDDEMPESFEDLFARFEL